MASLCCRTLPRLLLARSISRTYTNSSLQRLTNRSQIRTMFGCSASSGSENRTVGSNILRKVDGDKLTNRQVVMVQKRSYGGKPPYSIKTIQDRVMLTLQLFDKIKPEKLTLDSHFINDLGLDSLDHVEIMLQLEQEFTMEIPDADAERLMTPREIVQYICYLEDVFE